MHVVLPYGFRTFLWCLIRQSLNSAPKLPWPSQVTVTSTQPESADSPNPGSQTVLYLLKIEEHCLLDKLCRPKMIDALKAKFGDLNLTFSIGGQISFDVFPQVNSLWQFLAILLSSPSPSCIMIKLPLYLFIGSNVDLSVELLYNQSR